MNTAFFASVRSSLFGGSLSQAQVNGINAVFAAFERYGDGDRRKLAYALATKYHEVGQAMAPKVENLTYTSAARIREVWPKRFASVDAARPYVRQAQKLANFVYGNRDDLGNDQPNDGWKYRGRGDAQLTGKGRYERFSTLLDIDLVANPDLLLDVGIAAAVLVIGLVRGEFTGKKLADGVPDFVAARATVNADGKANGAKIAGYAEKFLAAMPATLVPGEQSKPTPIKPAPIPTETLPPAAPSTGRGVTGWLLLGGVIAAVAVWFVFFQR